MPNSCNSINKIISLCCLVFLTSCASLSQLTVPEKSFIGKFNFTHNKDSSNFNFKINLFPDEIIIQIGKPLLGNLIKININKLTGVTVYPAVQKEYRELFQIISSEDYFNFIEECLDHKRIKNKQNIITNDEVIFKCSIDDNGLISISIEVKELYYLKGMLKNE